MNKKNYILNNTNTRYFDYFFFKKLNNRMKPKVKNYLELDDEINYGITFTYNKGTSIANVNGKAITSGGLVISKNKGNLSAGKYTLVLDKALPFLINFSIEQGVQFRMPAGTTTITTTLTKDYVGKGDLYMAMTKDQEYNETFKIILTKNS